MSKQQYLALKHLENISWQVFQEYSDVIKDFIRGKPGVYVMYRKERLYYMGLASNLMNRLKIHLKNRHKGLWDRFNVYLNVHDEHMKELESLLLRINRPSGNGTSGKFIRSQNLKSALNRKWKNIDNIKRKNLIGRNVSHVIIKPTRRIANYIILSEDLELRNTYKKFEYHVILHKDWKLEYDGKLYDSLSAASKFRAGRQMNGWAFGNFKTKKEIGLN